VREAPLEEFEGADAYDHDKLRFVDHLGVDAIRMLIS
jgi:hypothetical protein